MNILQKQTPNYTKGRAGHSPELVVIHVMDGTLQSTDSWFATQKSRVSAHYGISQTGVIHQYVQEEDTAWHAGEVVNPTFALYKPNENPNLYCVTPDTPILMRDLSWKKAGDLHVGEKLLAFDEEAKNERRRHLTESLVEFTGIQKDQLYEIHLKNGEILRCNGEHKWLVHYGKGHGNRWMKTSEMESSMKTYKRKNKLSLSKFFDVFAPLKGYDAGYLAAAFDGEGHINFGGGNDRATQLGFAQKGNSMYAEVISLLTKYGFTFNSKLNSSDVFSVTLNGTRREVFRFLQLFQPKRLMDKFLSADVSNNVLSCIEGTEIIKVKKIGVGEVVTLQTSSKTYIANGYGSHNTIGIEHEGNGFSVWSDTMKHTSAQLLSNICHRYNIPIDREHVIGHYQIKATKPNCPANNKAIIDELILLAQEKPEVPTVAVQEKQIASLIAQIKSLVERIRAAMKR